jgi:hypothetical protein
MNNEHGICPVRVCGKEEDWNHMLRSEGTKIWRGKTLDPRFRNINAEINNERTEQCKNREQ